MSNENSGSARRTTDHRTACENALGTDLTLYFLPWNAVLEFAHPNAPFRCTLKTDEDRVLYR
eukprot:scaffold68019_cov58-Phaeocystis_antarctica.AAC.2